jgi:hypothetical protein
MGLILTKVQKDPEATTSEEPVECIHLEKYSEWSVGDSQTSFSAHLNGRGKRDCFSRGDIVDGSLEISETGCLGDKARIERTRNLVYSALENLSNTKWNHITAEWNKPRQQWDIHLDAATGHANTLSFSYHPLGELDVLNILSWGTELNIETTASKNWMQNIIEVFGLDQACKKAMQSRNPHGPFPEIFITDGALELYNTSQAKYFAAMEAALLSIIEASPGTIVVDRPPPTSDELSPIPYFEEIKLPADLPHKIMERLDIDGDGSISSVEEAWHAYALYYAKDILPEHERESLRPIIMKLAQVDPDAGSIKVYGHTFSVGSPHELGEYASTMRGYNNAFRKRLFAIGEAIRSFGPNIVKRWAKGFINEHPLRLVGLTPKEQKQRKKGMSILSRITDLFDTEPNMPDAQFLSVDNIVVTGAADNLLDQYLLMRHELGHNIDDMLYEDNPLSPFNIGLKFLSQIRGSVIREAYLSYLDTYLLDEQMESLRTILNSNYYNNELREFINDCLIRNSRSSTSFPSYNLTPEEWFAHIFEKPNMWEHATPELRDAIRRLYEGERAGAITGQIERSNISSELP